MKPIHFLASHVVLATLAAAQVCFTSSAAVIFETTSAYHHIQVIDQGGLRTLSFDGSMETRMSLQNPMVGHFEYTEYFYMPWLWNPEISRVLMVGLGGASTQRSFERYSPEVKIETVEIDPAVVRVAKTYFHLKESPRQRVHIQDGRMFLRRCQVQYDLVILDAYVQGRYGSSIPQHLATREFFEIVRGRLGEKGVLAYNVIGSLGGERADLVGALYRTMKEVFPQVYLFPAKESRNIVLVATRSKEPASLRSLLARGQELGKTRKAALPTFNQRIWSFRSTPPPNFLSAPVLTDDFSPIRGLLSSGP